MDEYEIFYMQKESSFFSTLWTAYYYVLRFLIDNGWSLLGAGLLGLVLWNWLQPKLSAWLQAREDARHHKAEVVLERERELRAVREERQREADRRSRLAAARRAELQEEKRRELAQLAPAPAGGHRLGSEPGFLPLSGGGALSTYRAPRRSACGGGGCG